MSRRFVISLIVGITILVPAGPALAAKSHPLVRTHRSVTHDQNYENWASCVRMAGADRCGDGAPG